MGRLYKVQQHSFFRTLVRIKIPVEFPDTLLDEFFQEVSRIDLKFNSHVKDSVTDRINRSSGHFVDIDEETSTLFCKVRSWSELTAGSFDMTVTPLLRLWGLYSELPATPPAVDQIANVLRLVDYRKVEIEEDRIRIDKGQEITTGGFLKGYAVDRVLEMMRGHGIKDGIINAGGSSIGCLTHGGHPVWGIEVNDPVDGTRTGMIGLTDGCCSTSSALSQQLIFQKGRYGHILNRITGMPVDNLQCGLLTPDGLSGDILSTALLQVTPDDFFPAMDKLTRTIPVEGYLVTGDHTWIVSDNIVGAFNRK